MPVVVIIDEKYLKSRRVRERLFSLFEALSEAGSVVAEFGESG